MSDYDVIVLGGDACHPCPRPAGGASDTIQPFPSFSGIYDTAVLQLRMAVADMPPPATRMDAQMATMPG